jgi:IMP cyclohydrolase
MGVLKPEEFVANVLLSDSAVSAIIGTKLSPEPAPQKTALPYVTYMCNGIDREYNIVVSTGMVNMMLQLNVMTSTYEGMKDLVDAIRLALNDYPKGVFTVGADTIDLRRVALRDETQNFIAPYSGQQMAPFNGVLLYEIVYREIVPTHT